MWNWSRNWNPFCRIFSKQLNFIESVETKRIEIQSSDLLSVGVFEEKFFAPSPVLRSDNESIRTGLVFYLESVAEGENPFSDLIPTRPKERRRVFFNAQHFSVRLNRKKSDQISFERSKTKRSITSKLSRYLSDRLSLISALKPNGSLSILKVDVHRLVWRKMIHSFWFYLRQIGEELIADEQTDRW